MKEKGLRLHWFLSRIWAIIDMLFCVLWIVYFFLMYRGRFNLANEKVAGLGFAAAGLALSLCIFLFRKELSMREYRLCTAKRWVFLLAALPEIFLTDFLPYSEQFFTEYLLLISVRTVMRILILIYYAKRKKLFKG